MLSRGSNGLVCGMEDAKNCLLTHDRGGTPRSGHCPWWEDQHSSTMCSERVPGTDPQVVEGLRPMVLWGGDGEEDWGQALLIPCRQT